MYLFGGMALLGDNRCGGWHDSCINRVWMIYWTWKVMRAMVSTLSRVCLLKP
ncbi:MAG: hypothetical protein Ct9H300mP19_08500 [Dehalococcoidia bacterium]|nr:MAG: hypothetical protein Ct9H300mP19_08500 [Dehalococcoidia bacterium]